MINENYMAHNSRAMQNGEKINSDTQATRKWMVKDAKVQKSYRRIWQEMLASILAKKTGFVINMHLLL